ncbi:hypothetical protein FACS1894170_11820 [Planctomycetales bacterium]|nr:hypothetical protein FACS1894170_11820 [Planctomycetales bacterium]
MDKNGVNDTKVSNRLLAKEQYVQKNHYVKEAVIVTGFEEPVILRF